MADDPIKTLLRDIRSRDKWDRDSLVEVLQQHFGDDNYARNPIIDRSATRFDNRRLELATRGIPTLQGCGNRLGTTHLWLGDLLADCQPFSDDYAARLAIGIDCEWIGLRARLVALERICAESKHGLDWLIGLEGEMPSFWSLPSLGDKIAYLAVKAVGRHFDAADARELRRLKAAFASNDMPAAVPALIGLAETGLTRGCKLGPVVPRLQLLREAGREYKLKPLVFLASKHLSELSQQYIERATSEQEYGRCYRVGLTFLLEAAEAQAHDRLSIADALEEILKSAFWRGIRAQDLLPRFTSDA